ncbi:MAG: phenylacetate--CoA ligase family protein [Acidimicrobiales bacterium]
MIFDADEQMPPAELRALQDSRWLQLTERLRSHPFHRRRLGDPAPIDGPVALEDIASIPFTTKQHLWDAYPLGLLAVDRSELRRLHATSGTKGRPTVAAYTAGDLDLFRNVNARALAAAGATAGSAVHNAYGYGLFTGGLGLHGGAELLGCAVLPISGGQTDRQVVLVRDLRPEVLCCTPSYAAFLGEMLQQAGVMPADNSLRVGIFGAEPWTEPLRLRIEALHGLTALDIYGLCEVIGPGVAFECLESRAELAEGGTGGLHVNEDHFYVEVVDPLTGDPLEDGEVGELVFTTLTKEAQPLIRYRSGDLSSLSRQPCACGRTTVRMSRLVGRSDDMFVIRGVNVFPSEIEAVLLSSPQLAPHYTIVLDSSRSMPEMVVVCELAATKEPDGTVDGLAQELSARLSGRLGVSGRVVVGPPGAVPRTEVGKAMRLVRRTPEIDGRPAELARLIDAR